MRLNIATSFNEKYVKYAYVMIYSLLKNQRKEDTVNIYILEASVSEEGKNIIRDLGEKFGANIIFVHVDVSVFPKDIKINNAWSLETYFRLLLQELITDVDEILYLDVDIIVNGSLRELFEMNKDDAMIYAHKDVSKVPFNDKRDVLFAEALEKGYEYFCAGIMLINLKKVREFVDFKSYMNLAKSWNYEMVAPDQDLLNGSFVGHVKYLDDKFSIFPKYEYNKGRVYNDIKKSGIIIHFAGDKPWVGGGIHYNIEMLWWDYAKETPYYSIFLEEFMENCIGEGFIFDTILNLINEKQMLMDELDKAKELLQKLSSLLKL